MILEAIHKINPKAECTVKNGDIDTIEWHGGTDPISKEEIEIALEEVKADYDSKQYQRDRKPEYGSWRDQLDMMYHGTWEAHVQAVKNKHPK